MTLEKKFKTVKGNYGALYHVEKNPDFSKIVWGNGKITINPKEVVPGKAAFQFLVDLLRLSGIKTNAKLEYGNLKSEECCADYGGARLYMPGRDLDINFYEDGKLVQISYNNFFLPRNPHNVVQMPPKAERLSERIAQMVLETNKKYGLNFSYYPCMRVRAGEGRDIAVSIHVDKLQVFDGKVLKFDGHAQLLGEVDRMILENFGHQTKT